MNYRKGTCTKCGNEDILIVKRMPSGNLCMVCNTIRLNEGKEEDPFKYRPKFKKRGATGEGALFLSIFATRPHVSFVSGAPLGDEPCAWMFAHILSKKKYPLFRLYDRNIQLLTFDEHYLLDFGSKIELQNNPDWAKLLELRESLKEEYSKMK